VQTQLTFTTIEFWYSKLFKLNISFEKSHVQVHFGQSSVSLGCECV